MRTRLSLIVTLPLLSGFMSSAAFADDLGSGTLLAVRGGGEKVAFPLERTTVDGHVVGPIAGVHVTQRFTNPYEETLEAIYVFPLPEGAAVDDFELIIGSRIVKGVLKKRADAKADYDRAKAEGQAAALLDQERPNIFTVAVANVQPKVGIEVRLHYVERLRYLEGAYELTFPMTVGPRFGATDGPKSYVSKGRSSNRVDIRYEVEAGVPIEALTSPTHEITMVRDRPMHAMVRADDLIANKDFTLRIGVAGGELHTGVLASRENGRDGHFLLILQPKADADVVHEVTPKEMVFVLDTSCSMSGRPIEMAKAVMAEAVRGMNPDDAFQILGFDDDVSSLGASPLPNSPDNVERGLAFIRAFHGGGGTVMNGGITAALSPPEDPERMRMVFFMTDGYIGNERQILDTISKTRKNARIFSYGIGSSVHRYLISEMGAVGKGFAEFVRLTDEPKAAAREFYRRIEKPVLTDIAVDFGELAAIDVIPHRIPDLFEGQPLVLVGRYDKPGRYRIWVNGKVRGKVQRRSVVVDLPAQTSGHEAIAKLWARRKIAELTRLGLEDPSKTEGPITEVALEYGLASAYTSFVAVDHERHVDPSKPGRTVLVPSELPEGVLASSIGGSLSRTEIPPGDPTISIDAPKDARRVTAYFPFGLTKQLTFDPTSSKWRARFLVPKGIDDGWYHIRVIVEGADGRTETLDLPYHLDASGEPIAVELASTEVRRQSRLSITVETTEAAREVSVYAECLGDAQHLLRHDGGSRWSLKIEVPKAAAVGSHELVVVARDLAGNRTQTRVSFEVVR